MIFYFSGAGNSQNVAQVISEALSEPVLSVDKCIEDGNYHFTMREGEVLGVVCGVHFFGIPAIMHDFLSRLTFDGIPSYTFAAVTYGTISGFATRQIKKALNKVGIELDARFSIRMVDTWTPMFNLSNKNRTYERTRRVQTRIHEIADIIRRKKTGVFDYTRIPYTIGRLYYYGYDSKRKTAHFHVLGDRCNFCGKCARNCPVDAISIDINGRPYWQKPECTLCLRCLHNCSKHAIQYGKHTVNHGQFINPFVKRI